MDLAKLSSILKTLILNIELAFRLFFDFRIPLLPKLLFLIVFAIYLLFPLDFIPDFLPAIGQADDLILFIFLMFQFINSCPIEIIDEHKQAIMGGEWKIQIFKYLVKTGE